jgi:hypothetical protein
MHCLAAARVARNDADLRVVLRHIPILPPPKTIDDLVARLDQKATGASAVLAQIVQDARSDNSAGPEQGRINVVGRPQSDARPAPSEALQLKSRWTGILLPSLLFGAVLVSTVPLRGDRSLLTTPTAHASDELVRSSAAQDPGRVNAEPTSPRPELVQIARSPGIRDASHDARVRFVTTPPASSKIRTARSRKSPARQRAVRAQYTASPAGLVCGIARMLLLKCNLRA